MAAHFRETKLGNAARTLEAGIHEVLTYFRYLAKARFRSMHFIRNILCDVPRTRNREVGASLKAIFAQEDKDHAALIPGFREVLRDCLHKTKALVTYHKANAFQTAFLKMPQESQPAFRVLLPSFHCADNLAVSGFIYANRYQNGCVFDGATPVFFEVDAVQIHIRIFHCKWPVAPFLDLYIDLLVELAYRTRRYLRTPERFRDVFYPPN